MKENTSSIGKMERHLMSQEEKMLKDKQLLSGVNMVEPTRDGKSLILMKLKDHKRRDFMMISDSISTDHSTLSQDFQ